jgi:alkylation response protein AidB-like acyl-CoA dehydrogenase
MKEYPAERWMRNAKIFQIFGGTNQVKRKNLLKTMIERDPMKARK